MHDEPISAPLYEKYRIMQELADEIRAHHPQLWAQIATLTPRASLPYLNEYCGTDVQATTRASEAVRTWMEVLVQRRSN